MKAEILALTTETLKKGKFETYKDVPIPHLRFKVLFLDMSKLQGVERRGAGYTAQFEDDSVCVFIEDIEQSVKQIERIPVIAHELVHVLQILCDKFAMKAENEIEHLAYIHHYLLQEVLDV